MKEEEEDKTLGWADNCTGSLPPQDHGYLEEGTGRGRQEEWHKDGIVKSTILITCNGCIKIDRERRGALYIKEVLLQHHNSEMDQSHLSHLRLHRKSEKPSQKETF